MVDRTQRVKDARTESAKEIEAYKTQKEKEFKKFESEVHPPPQSPAPTGTNLFSTLGQTHRLRKRQRKTSYLNSQKSMDCQRNRDKRLWMI
jgi:hypothetical protein